MLNPTGQDLAGLTPIAISLTFMLMLGFFVINFSTIRQRFKSIKRETWILLLLIFIFGSYLRFFVAPHHHIMYIDEQWYMDAGKNMIHRRGMVSCNFVDYNEEHCYNIPKPAGWPFVIGLSFLFFGESNWSAIYASSSLSSLSIILMFLVVYLLFKNEKIGLWSAFLLSVIPLNIQWSGNAETHIASVFFILLSMFGLLVYASSKTIKTQLLAIALIAYAIQTRPENYILIFLTFLFLLVFDKRLVFGNRKRVWLLWILLIILILPNLANIWEHYIGTNWSESHTGAGSDNNFSFDNLRNNMSSYGVHLFDNRLHPYIFDILFFFGLISCFVRNKKSGFLLCAYFITFLIIYLSSWMKYHGYRDFNTLYIFMVAIAGYGAYILVTWLRGSKGYIAQIVLVILVLYSFNPYIQNLPWSTYNYAALLETRIPDALESYIPENCYVIMDWPTILSSTTNIKVVPLYRALDSSVMDNLLQNTDCVLFFEDMYCFYMEPVAKDRCQKMHQKYRLEEHVEFELNNITYRLYRVVR